MRPEFIKNIVRNLQNPLPGKVAHKRMSPSHRFPFLKSPNVLQSKRGAVLIMLYQQEDLWYFPIILRPTYDGEHSGQLSLPGGKREFQDVDYKSTALRETEEEIGINISDIEILGELSTIYIPKSNYIVHPFIGYVSSKPRFVADKKEVEKIIEISVDSLSDVSILDFFSFELNGKQVKAPSWKIDEHKLWGATAMVLAEFCDVANTKIDSI